MGKKVIMRYSNKNTANKKVSFGIFFFFIFLKASYSQDFKLAGIHYVNYPKSEIKDVSRNQKTSFQEFGAFVNFPKKLKNNKTTLINSFGYGFVEATMYNFTQPQTNEYEIKLQEFYYQLILLHKWNEKWSSLVNLKPTLASDFGQKLSSDDFTFQGAVIATRKLSSTFKIGGGVANTMRFGTSKVLPVFNLHYKNNKHQINALLPLNFKYTYALLPEEKLEVGIKYTLNGANFNIADDNLPNIDKINYSRANIGMLANYHFTKIFRLEAYGGLSTNRKYNLVGTNDNVIDFDSKTAPFFNVGIVLISPKRK
jgi:hypothetical protein